MTYYDEQLKSLQQQVARKARIEALLKDLHNQRVELDKKVTQLKDIKQDEQADVDRLEGRSLASFFYNVVGNKDEKLDKERREAYEAAVKYDVAVRELTAMEEDIKRYENELKTLHGCENSYEQVLKEKATAIKSSGIHEVAKMMEMEEQIAFFENQKKEIEEAICAGNKADKIAEEVLSHLKHAENWGTWDLFGGGLIADLGKHSALDKAQQVVEDLQVQLRRFKTELADVTINADMQVNIEGFLRFADYFFDGLFSDLATLNRINDSQNHVQNTKNQIENVLNKLSSMLNAIEDEHVKTKSELDDLIVKAML